MVLWDLAKSAAPNWDDPAMRSMLGISELPLLPSYPANSCRRDVGGHLDVDTREAVVRRGGSNHATTVASLI
jgi:hypothetical protein